MKSDFWDTSALLSLVLARDPFHKAAGRSFRPGSKAARRSRAEFYAAATGRLAIPPDVAISLLLSLEDDFTWVSLKEEDEARVILSSPKRGIQGRILYDALIAETATLSGCNTIVTANPSDFRHVLPHADIVDLTAVARD